jgi:hypothetical protein
MPGLFGFGLQLANGGFVFTPGGGGGGGVTPAFPISSDFVNGLFMVGDQSCAVGDIWVEDLVNYGSFNPASDIVPGQGLASTGFGQASQPTLHPSLVPLIVDGFLAVMELSVPASYADAGTFLTTIYAQDVPDYNVAFGSVLFSGGDPPGFVYGQNTGHDLVDDPGVGALRTFVAQCTPTRQAASINHQPVVGYDIDQSAVPANSFALSAPSWAFDQADTPRIRKLTLYAPGLEADMPALGSPIAS